MALSDKEIERLGQWSASALSLIEHARKLGYTVTIENDPDDPTNPGLCYSKEKKITLSKFLLRKPEELIVILMHEIGHIHQFLENRDYNLAYSALVEAEDRGGWRNSSTQKYWLDDIGSEYEAWLAGLRVARQLNIEFDERVFSLVKFRCLRRSLKYVVRNHSSS